MESKILGAIIASRTTFNLVCEHLSDKDFSKDYQIVKKLVNDYYARDQSASKVDVDLLIGLMEAATANKKHQERFSSLIQEAALQEVSTTNVDSLILQGKLEAIGNRIAVAMVNKTDPSDLIEEWKVVKSAESLSDIGVQGTEVLDSGSFREVFKKKADGSDLLKVWPLAINNYLRGGVGPGHHIVTFARPEMGKTALNVTIACGFANQGARGIYFLNEDVLEDVYVRAVCCLTSQPEEVVLRDLDKWEAVANSRGLTNITFVSLAPGTLAEVERFIEQLEPRWIVMDQLRNLQMKETNKVLQLEYATSGLRNIGKKWKIVVVSTTQAGDSAEGKRILDMGDIDFSNTGVPAQADVLIGIGASKEDAEGMVRYASICKNKRGGGHAQIPLRLIPQISRYKDSSN